MKRSHAICTIHLAAPIERCFRFFTPAGEELWVDGWSPSYRHPADGTTEPGMVFTTGEGEDYTIWTLVDFDEQACRSRYSRVTPALRCGLVEVQCRAAPDGLTQVDVQYTLTALTPAGEASLEHFVGAPFEAMIRGWQSAIESRLPALLAESIR